MRIAAILWRIVVMVLIGTLVHAAEKGAEKGLVAHYTFDEGQGETAHDLSGYGNDGKIHNAVFVKSPRGFALQFDEAKRSFVDCGRNPILNLSGDMTTVVWIKVPADSAGDKFIYGDTASLALNRNFYLSANARRLRMEHGNATGSEQLLTDAPVFDGSWQCVAMLCEFPYYRVYVNGREVHFGQMTMPITPTAITPRHIGGWWWEKGYFTGEMDELRVYNRALSERELLELAGLPSVEAKPEVSVVTPVLHYARQRISVDVLLKGVDPAKHRVHLSLRSKDGNVIFERTEAVRETRTGSLRGIVTTAFDAATVAPGAYVLAAALEGEGVKDRLPATKEVSIAWPEKPEWFGSQAGISREVLAPYTPLELATEAAGLTVKIWGRTYRFGAAPLLAAVTSKDKALLAGPMRILARTGGRAVEFAAAAPRAVETAPDRAVLVQEATGNDLALSIRTLAEYDGFLRMDLALKAAAPVTLDALVLDIPLAPSVAKYFYYWQSGGADLLNGALTEDRALPFVPFVWIGDDEKGLQWFAESSESWSCADRGRAIQVLRRPKETTLRLNLATAPVALDPAAPRTFTFGFQATPLKPIALTNWDYRFHHISQQTHGPVDTILKISDAVLDRIAASGAKTIAFHEHWTRAQCYTKTPYEEDLRSLVRRCHARGMRLVLYFGFNISDLIPEWPYIGEDCVTYPKFGYLPSDYPPQPIQNAYVVCLQSVYQDLLCDGVARLIDDFDIDGVYLDSTCMPTGCSNPNHGCGYNLPDGTRAATYPVFAVRDTFRRLYTVIRQRKPDGIVDAHVYDCMNAPALAFATSYWTGEQLKRGKFITDGLSLDRFRAECMGVNWGVPAEFLHYMLGSYTDAWALALLHDVPTRANTRKDDLELEASVWKVFDAFDRAGATFLPYWSNGDVVSVTPSDCYASLYRHPKNGVLAMVSNLSRNEASVALRLNGNALGLPAEVSAEDALGRNPVVVANGVVQVNLPSLGWTLVWVRAKP